MAASGHLKGQKTRLCVNQVLTNNNCKFYQWFYCQRKICSYSNFRLRQSLQSRQPQMLWDPVPSAARTPSSQSAAPSSARRSAWKCPSGCPRTSCWRCPRVSRWPRLSTSADFNLMLHCLIPSRSCTWVDVHVLHEPARLVSADGNGGEVERPELAADLLEAIAMRGVTAEPKS